MDQNLSRDFKGIWIPKEIWLNPDLSIEEKVLFAEIDSLDGPDGCYASNEYLCKFFGWRERTLQNHLSRLKNLGLIESSSFDGRTRVLRVRKETTHENFDTSAPQQKSACTSEVQKFAPLPCKNLHPSKNSNLPVEPKGNLHHIVENKEKNIVCSATPCRGAAPALNREDGIKTESYTPPVKIKDFQGKESVVKIDDLFTWSVLRKKNWTSQEIQDCWEILSNFNGPVRDVFRFVEGTIVKRRNSARAASFNKKNHKEKKCQTTSNTEEPKLQTNSSVNFADRDTIAQIFDL